MSEQFYAAILPSEGAYCVVGIASDGKIKTSFHDSLDAATQTGRALCDAGINAYFALATFKDVSAGRKSANAHQLKSFYIDLDCGEGKPYPDQASAGLAVRTFVAATGLPRPYIVNSGNGLHVYWPLETAIDVAAWAPIARKFKHLCIANGLHIDRTVTADAARILRMPGTTNFKRSPMPVVALYKGVVASIDTIKAALPDTAEEVDLSVARTHGADAMTRALAGDDFPPSSFTRIVKRSLKGTGCAQIKQAVEHAASLEEPLWRAALSIAWRCTDAETTIHTLSRPHPEYTPEATVRKAGGTLGPTTCAWYKDNYGGTCAGCTHAVTSPILLGRKVEEAPAVNDTYVVDQQYEPDNTETGNTHVVQVNIPAYPKPYFRGVNGGVFMRTKDKDGDPIELEVYRYDLYVTRRYYDSAETGDGEGELVTVNLHTPHDGIRRFIAPVKILLTKEKMRDLLLTHGVVAINRELDNIMAYFASSIRNLQKMIAADRTRNQMGWTQDESGFVVGEFEYTDSGTILAPASNATRSMVPIFTQKGSLAKWTEMVDFYSRPGMEIHAFAVFTGFGAPLIRLLGDINVRGAIIHLMSNASGSGKTTTQMVANSIFGHPSMLLLKKEDTVASKIQWMGLLNSLLVTMDEVTNMSPEAVSELAYEIPQGRGKHRMESQVNKLRANSISWSTLALTSGNGSMYDILSKLKSTADGEMRRIIELRVERPTEVVKVESDRAFSALADNYGLAGPVFIQHVMTHREEVLRELESVRRTIDKRLKLTQADRFYSVVLACIFVGASIAQRLGLHHIEIMPVFKAIVSRVQGIKEEVLQPLGDTGKVAHDALITYVNENMASTLVINAATKGDLPNAPLNHGGFRGPLRMRYEPDTRELWIPSSALRDYFVSRQIDVRKAIHDLAAAGVIKNRGASAMKRLGAGAMGNFDAGAVRCFCIEGAFIGPDDGAIAVPTT